VVISRASEETATMGRNYWISFQTRKFEQMPEFETVSVGTAYETAPDVPRLLDLHSQILSSSGG
jgi:hypothetical protein